MWSSEVKEALIQEVKPDDLGDLHPMTVLAVKTLGAEAFMRLCEAIGGVSIYIPKIETAVAMARDRLILQEFNQNNYAELAVKYNVSDVWVRQIVAKEKLRKNSISLFQDDVFS